MKKRICIVSFASAMILLMGCAAKEAQLDYIGSELAKTAALEVAGLSDYEVSSISIVLSDRDGQKYYKVDFYFDGQEYDFDIDALTGKVLASQMPIIEAGEESSQTAEEDEESSVVAAESDAAQEEASKPEESSMKEESQTEAAEEESKSVIEESTIEESTVEESTVKESRLEEESVVEPTKEEESDSSGGISEEQAKNIALAQVPGATIYDLDEFEVDIDDGKLVYEGSILYGGLEYEFEIDGYSGAIRDWEVEEIDD